MATGFGKVILLGEHFVVHGAPAIAAAVEHQTRVGVISELPEGEVTINDQRESTERAEQMVHAILREMGIKKGVSLRVESTIPIGFGMGSSAAFSVAVTRELAENFHMVLDAPEVVRVATAGENVVHQTSSGLDPSIATYGGLIWFRRNLAGGMPLVEPFHSPHPLPLVVANSKQKGDTGKMVGKVKRFKEQEPDGFQSLLARAEHLAREGKSLIEQYNLLELGKCMEEAHTLLQKVGVSTPQLDEMVECAREAGAVGAKLSGGGGGGIIIALCPENPEKVQEALKNKGYDTILTRVGVVS